MASGAAPAADAPGAADAAADALGAAVEAAVAAALLAPAEPDPSSAAFVSAFHLGEPHVKRHDAALRGHDRRAFASGAEGDGDWDAGRLRAMAAALDLHAPRFVTRVLRERAAEIRETYRQAFAAGVTQAIMQHAMLHSTRACRVTLHFYGLHGLAETALSREAPPELAAVEAPRAWVVGAFGARLRHALQRVAVQAALRDLGARGVEVSDAETSDGGWAARVSW